MSISGISGSSALGVLTSAASGHMQQRIAAKVVMDQMESEAEMVTKLVESSPSTASSPGVGKRVDARA